MLRADDDRTATEAALVRRAWVEPEELSGVAAGDRVRLSDEAAHHLVRVLRLAPGDDVELFDGGGRLARGRLAEDGRVEVAEVLLATPPLPPLVVAQALVRGPKLEEVVRRATELGASEVRVFEAERSNAPSARLDRLERVAQQAARQAERAHVPRLYGPAAFAELLEVVKAFEGRCAMGVLGAERSLSALLSSDEAFRARGLLVVVGPEGGLSATEQGALRDAGCVPVSLGAHVLRTETAALAALACAQVAIGVL